MPAGDGGGGTPGDGTGRTAQILSILGVIVAAITTTLGGVISISGGWDPLIRNAPIVVGVAIVSFVVAAGAMAAVDITLPQDKRLRNGTTLVAILVFVGAAGALLWQGVTLASEPIRPSIAAKVVTDTSGDQRLSGTVTVSNLPAADSFRVRVVGLKWLEGAPSTPLYDATIGAGSDGKATIELDFPISAALYDQVEVRAWPGSQPQAYCGQVLEPATRGACMEMPLPRDAAKPLLTAEVVDSGTGRVVNAALRFRSPSTATGGAILRIAVTGKDQQPIASYDSFIYPNGQGLLSRTVTLPIPDVDATVCAVAFVATDEGVSPEAACPVVGAPGAKDAAVDWVRIDVQASDAAAAGG